MPFQKLEPTRERLFDLPDTIRLVKSESLQDPQAYTLKINLTHATIRASSETGWHYGLVTLQQLARFSGEFLPQCRIEDHPDFERRGIMLDISRNKVPKLETLFYLIDLFTDWKINELQLHIEHTFAFEGHEVVWENASPLTREDIRKLDAYCHDRFIELVPNLNCFGHMSRWLIHDVYRPLAEQPRGGNTDFGYRAEPQGLCPTDPGSIVLAKDIIHQMVACFRSKQVNVGCDETIDLGYGRSKEWVREKGRGRVYLDYLKQIHAICTGENRRMQFWADIILKYPELIPEIPTGCIALDWGYEATHPFESETACLQSSGTPFYVCPGTSSWNSIGGRSRNMRANILSAAKCGKQNGAIGLMVTDWGDNGHWQPLVSGFPGFVLGASKAWNESHEASLEGLLDAHVFQEKGWGHLLLQLGNHDQSLDIQIHNMSALFSILQEGRTFVESREELTVSKLSGVMVEAAKLQRQFEKLLEEAPIDPVLMDEISWIIQMLTHAGKLGYAILERQDLTELQSGAGDLRDRHHYLWQLRNRPGGYESSKAGFQILCGE